MKEMKAILVCIVPFVVAALVLYPFMAIVGADFDPFEWERADRWFYMIASTGAGVMLLARVLHVHEWEGK